MRIKTRVLTNVANFFFDRGEPENVTFHRTIEENSIELVKNYSIHNLIENEVLRL